MLLYRLLLSLYPASFRTEYGVEMLKVFQSELRDAISAGARARLWLLHDVGSLRCPPGAAGFGPDVLGGGRSVRPVLTSAGLAIGLFLSWMVGRWLSSLLAGVSPSDALAFGSASALVPVMAALGSVMRAVRVSPIVALRD